MEQPTLTTPRLLLRAYQPGDAARVTELVGNYEVARTTQNIPHPYTLDMAREWIASQSTDPDHNNNLVYAVLLQSPQQLVGAVSLINIAQGEASLGYWIGQPWWGQGICTEAVAALLQHGFASLRLSRVYADHFVQNPASGRVMQKNGMRLHSRREAPARDNQPTTILRYEIFRS